LQTWKERYARVRLSDTGMYTNQNLSFARALGDMIINAEALLKGALSRNESRGAHYKPEFPERDDVNYLKTTIAIWNKSADEVEIKYAPVDTSLVTPRPRTYGKTGTGPKAAEAKADVASLAPQPALAMA
ncbi:MAG: hypothetical protein ACTHLZ_07350, partial [Tepidisphaeraceae bacterium]